MKEPLRIIVDADACPVKREIVETAKRFQAEVIMVASYDHYLAPEDGMKVVQVDRSDQSVDLYISNHILPDDILVTQDFGLAAVGLGKRAIVISNRGQQYTNETIDFLLARRHELVRMRREGKRTKGPRPFTHEDRAMFQHCLTKVLQQLQDYRFI